MNVRRSGAAFFAPVTPAVSEIVMIKHKEIPQRYKGWQAIERSEGIQYWNEENKQSIFFFNESDGIIETGTPTRREKTRPGKDWIEFELRMEWAGISLTMA